MSKADRAKNRDRIKAALAAGAFQILLGYALITGLGFHPVAGMVRSLKTFDVTEKPPPPPVDEILPAEATTKAAEGAASAQNLRARPSPVVAPPPRIRIKVPPPVVAAPVTTNAPGSDPSAGASDKAGPGSGSGGLGTGTGSGGAGSGSGGGASRARRESGRLVNADYPRAALRARVEGAVSVRFVVGGDGRVSGCVVIKSSGNAELDATTCRLIEKRFRYRPATDASGNPVAEAETSTFEWSLATRNEPLQQ